MSKILVVRFSSIGDIVLTSPVVRCIKKQLPEAEVHFLTKQSFASIIESNPFIDNHFYLENDFNLLVKRLKIENYDVVIDLHHNLRSAALKSRLRTKSFSFPKLNVEKWLMVNFKINRLPPLHIVDRYFETVKKLGVTNDGQGLDFFISPADEMDLKLLPARHQSGFVAFAIGAKHATKRLPDAKLISICRKISLPVILLGGSEDAERGNMIQRESDGKVASYCGKINLGQSASLVKQAAAVITHDTGLMHIAAAFKKKIISVWGNTVPEFGMFPYLPGERSKIIEVKKLSCRPCSKLGFDKCPKGHFNCMMKIGDEEIVNAV